jgi:hypothetical protein
MASPCSPPCQLPPQPPVYPPPHHNLPSPPASDVQLLDYSSSPSPRRKTSPRSSHVPSQTSLHPEGAAFITSFQAPWDGAGRAGATTVKASSSATVGSKMDVATPSDHGWQVVHLKKWRKKLAAYPPPPQGHRPSHERGRHPDHHTGEIPKAQHATSLSEIFKKGTAGRCF